MSNFCLTSEEIAEITDARTRALQIAWFDSHGWTYELSRLGNPKVARSYAEQKMGVGRGATAAAEPDFSHWEKAA
jgi:hypothetical protein